MKTKICSKCGIEKCLSEFHQDKSHIDKVSSSCKKCRTKFYQERYRKMNKKILRKKYKLFYKKYKKKILERSHNWYKNNHEKIHDYRLKKIYNINIEQYNLLLKKQHYCCAICKKSIQQIKHKKVKKLGVDHNHLTGQVRGLLCHKCNSGLGSFEENLTILKNAMKYLK